MKGMLLYIVRHGIAQPRDDQCVSSEADRALTPKGARRTRLVAYALRTLGCRPNRIATSPFRRAEETAQILTEVLDPEEPLEVCGFLAPGAAVDDLATWLRDVQDESVMIVAHMPDTANIASDFLSEEGIVSMTMRQSAVCCISFDEPPREGGGRLEWLLQPHQLRSMIRTE